LLKRKSRQKEKHSLRAIPIPLLKRNSRQKEKGSASRHTDFFAKKKKQAKRKAFRFAPYRFLC